MEVIDTQQTLLDAYPASSMLVLFCQRSVVAALELITWAEAADKKEPIRSIWKEPWRLIHSHTPPIFKFAETALPYSHLVHT